MNKTDRLFAIILELQAKRQRRAEDLAKTFEVNKRTIYRDVQALSEMGVPVVAVPGQGYSLMEGYFLPPLRFTTDEATMLLLGADFVAQNFDAQYRAAALSASRKLEAVLPDTLKANVHYLQNSIRFVSMNELSEPQAEMILQLRRALGERKTVRFDYYARFGDNAQPQTQREADPYGIANLGGIWYLIAHDHTRRARRNFRIDRMENLQLLNKTFTRPRDFQMRQEDALRGRQVTIRALFTPASARWVREARYYFVTETLETADGLLVTLRVREVREALQWLLSWGSQVRVVEPASLREILRVEAEKMLENAS
jgi:predicted DNA-binding transcriptional regulator YafY